MTLVRNTYRREKPGEEREMKRPRKEHKAIVESLEGQMSVLKVLAEEMKVNNKIKALDEINLSRTRLE